MDDLVGAGVVLDVHEGADATNVVSSGDENGGAVLEFNNGINLASLEVKL